MNLTPKLVETPVGVLGRGRIKMKLTKEQLVKIVREELNHFNEGEYDYPASYDDIANQLTDVYKRHDDSYMRLMEAMEIYVDGEWLKNKGQAATAESIKSAAASMKEARLAIKGALEALKGVEG